MADTLVLSILANLQDNASGGLGKLKGGIAGVREEGSRANQVLGFLAKGGALVGGGMLAAAGGAVAATLAYAENAAEIAKVSNQTGIAVGALSVLQHQANRSRVDFDDLKGAIEEMNLRFGEASLGAEPFIARFRAIGVDVDELRDKKPEEIFYEVAEAIAAIPDPGERAFAADEIFGGDAFKILPLINQGAEGLAKLRGEAHDLGLVMSDETAKSAQEFQASIQQLQASVGAIVRQVGAALLPILSRLAKTALPIVQRVVKFTTPLLTAFGEGFAFVIDNALKVVDTIYNIFEPAVNFIGNVLQRIGLISAPAPDTSPFDDALGGLEARAKEAVDATGAQLGKLPAEVDLRLKDSGGAIRASARGAIEPLQAEFKRILADTNLDAATKVSELTRILKSIANTGEGGALAELRSFLAQYHPVLHDLIPWSAIHEAGRRYKLLMDAAQGGRIGKYIRKEARRFDAGGMSGVMNIPSANEAAVARRAEQIEKQNETLRQIDATYQDVEDFKKHTRDLGIEGFDPFNLQERGFENVGVANAPSGGSAMPTPLADIRAFGLRLSEMTESLLAPHRGDYFRPSSPYVYGGGIAPPGSWSPPDAYGVWGSQPAPQPQPLTINLTINDEALAQPVQALINDGRIVVTGGGQGSYAP